MKAVHVYIAAVLLLLSSLTDAGRSIKGAASMKKERDKSLLSLRGRVSDVKLVRENDDSIVFDVTLNLEFTNNSDKPVITLHREFWIGAKTLARSPEDAAAYKYLYASSHWPSISASPEWGGLRQRLDQPSPPPDLMSVLAAGETLPYKARVTLYVEKAGSFDKTSQKWDTIKQASPVWLQVTLEMWPINIEPRVDPENPAFGKMLQQRWQQYGELQIDRLTSESMNLDLANVTLTRRTH